MAYNPNGKPTEFGNGAYLKGSIGGSRRPSDDPSSFLYKTTMASPAQQIPQGNSNGAASTWSFLGNGNSGSSSGSGSSSAYLKSSTMNPVNGGNFTPAQIREAQYREAKYREALTAQNPTAGAVERMRRAQQAASMQGTNTAGQALAGGGFGSTRAALLGMARMRAQSAAQGTLAADQVAEQDLGRQQQTNLFNADAFNQNSQFNAGAFNDNSMFNAGAFNQNSQFNASGANNWNMSAAQQSLEQAKFKYAMEQDAAAEKLRKEAESRTRRKSQGPDIWYAQDSIVGGMRHTGPMVRLPNGTSIPLSTWRLAGFGGG